jgi:hypothetical protein
MMELTKAALETYAARYDEHRSDRDRDVEAEMKGVLTTQRFLTKPQFVKIGMWKSPRPKKWYERFDDEVVKEITAFSFSAKTEQARIGCCLCCQVLIIPSLR